MARAVVERRTTDDAPDAAAALAVEDVCLERPFEEFGPGDGPRRGVGAEDAEVADEVEEAARDAASAK